MNNMTNGYWEGHWQNPRYRSISLDQAIDIALKRVPGEVVKAELDFDDGVLLYEIDIRTNQGLKYEVKVDAVSGQVLRVKLD
ncbi:PepSY domain-containing protein [Sporosarcina luteola]|uniref:PepSY domain-containing protein n=2 Tax=Bacillales TaxID=1385 RepID=UPI00203DDCCF|nr:PepSY domain-containing protein [Sporosarcina luteola]MCM3638082.1 PepSY domain-containing protein [Sporosarcina luteola]MCM3710146.1 PepSY domain-containing protein [Sporosarcina luteola]